MSLLDEWVNHALTLAGEPGFYSGARKILRGRSLSFSTLDDSLQLGDAGYTKSKLSLLTNHYKNEESIAVAQRLWEHRCAQEKYGSVSFTTFNHYVKGKGTVEEIIEGRGKRASVFGPCIQSVCITWVNKKAIAIDVFYRTTEFFKKFPADLVLIRDVLLPGFNLPPSQVTIHFANITMHPMYFVTLIPHLDDPIKTLTSIKAIDEHFHNWIVKWSARYLIEEYHNGIAKFAQALRVQKDCDERISPRIRKKLVPYLQANHIGIKHRGGENEDDEGE